MGDILTNRSKHVSIPLRSDFNSQRSDGEKRKISAVSIPLRSDFNLNQFKPVYNPIDVSIPLRSDFNYDDNYLNGFRHVVSIPLRSDFNSIFTKGLLIPYPGFNPSKV